METQPTTQDQTSISAPVADNVVIEGGAKKKKSSSKRRSSRKSMRRGKAYGSGKTFRQSVFSKSRYEQAVDEANQLAISRGEAVQCKYYHKKNQCDMQANCNWRKGSANRKGNCAKVAGTERVLSPYGSYESVPVPALGPNMTLSPEELAQYRSTYSVLGGKRSSRRRSSRGSISKLQARAKKLCVKASGSKAAIRQRIKSAKKSKKAVAKRCARKNM